MNPGEQNQNNFGQPGPIMSSPNDTVPSPAPAPISSGQPSASTSRFFGGASRYKGPRTRSASNPEYFSQPAPTPGPIAMSEPLPQYKERKSKAPIFIGIGAIAVIGIIVAAIMLLPGLANGGGASEEEIADLTNLMKEYGEGAVFYDREIRETLRLEIPSDTTTEYKNYKQQLTSNLESVKTLNEKLSNIKKTKAITKTGSNDEIDVDEKIEELKKLLSERISLYEKYAEVMIPYVDIYATEGNSGAITKFEEVAGSRGKNITKKLSNYYNARKQYNQAFNKRDCITSQNVCTAALEAIFVAEDTINDDQDMTEIGKDIAGKKLPQNDILTLINLIKQAQVKNENNKEGDKQ